LRLPSKTEIVVGPGFTRAFLPGYPANKDSPILQIDYEWVGSTIFVR
jgi:hypothetical protein